MIELKLAHMWVTKYKGRLRSNEVVKSPRLHIEHLTSYHKTIQTRTFLPPGEPLPGLLLSPTRKAHLKNGAA